MYTESIFIYLISSLKDDFYNILKRPPMHPPQPFFNDFHDLKKKTLSVRSFGRRRCFKIIQ